MDSKSNTVKTTELQSKSSLHNRTPNLGDAIACVNEIQDTNEDIGFSNDTLDKSRTDQPQVMATFSMANK